DADAEAGAREGLAPDDLVGQAQLGADGAHLVLEQGAQRLDQLEGEVLGQAADVVVALDVRRALAAAGLDDVGVERALDEKGGGRLPDIRRVALALDDALLAQDLRLGLLEGADELAPDDLALGLGVGDAGERGEELLLGVDHEELRPAGGGAEGLLDLLGLVLAHQAVVHVHAGEAVADGALHERRGDGGVHAAGESADRGALAHLGADPLDLLLDDVAGGPGRLDAAPRWRKFSSTSWPRSEWPTSGCHCTP